MDVVLKPARRSVEIATAKSAVVVYGDIVGIGPHYRLYRVVDIGDIASAVNVFTANVANTDNIACCCYIEATECADDRIITTRIAVDKGLRAYCSIAKTAGVVSKRRKPDACIIPTIAVV